MTDKIKIFLTDQIKSRTGSKEITNLSRQIMLSVAPFYNNRESAKPFRDEYGLMDKHATGWDSGGFQFLMGKLETDNEEYLPCGIKVPASAQDTIDIYNKVGVEKRDFPIQLDLPPRYAQSPEVRKQLITRSAGYYYEMVEKIPATIPVIHGWTLEEMQYNLDLVKDPEKAELAVGTSLTEMRGNWTMGNLNPHDPKGDKPLHEKITYVKEETKQKPKPKRVSYKVILDRIATALNYLKNDYDIFMLGGASPHMISEVFMCGASWTDTSAWRIKALMAEIYLWEHSSGHNSFRIGYSDNGKYIDEEGKEILKEYLQNPTHPICGMPVNRFLTIGKMRMKEWRDTWEKNQWEFKPVKLRALHNAWFLKNVIEVEARDYACDPDGYYKHLANILEPRPILSKRLDALYEKIC